MPGVVDLHTDSLEPELEPRPGVQLAVDMALGIWENRALAAGITTAFVTLSFGKACPAGAAQKRPWLWQSSWWRCVPSWLWT